MNANLSYYENWVRQARKGVLEVCILRRLREGERYGYDLVRSLVGIPGAGVSEGTIYPLLSRLRGQGLVSSRLVESAEGPARKYYALTPGGLSTLLLMEAHWDQLVDAVNVIEESD